MTAKTPEGGDRLPEGFFEKFLLRAHARGASHVHLEPDDTALRVRYRVDGVLRAGESLPLDLHAPLLERAKHAAGLEPREARLPQLGSFTLPGPSAPLLCQVETLPGVLGEKVTVWLREPARRVERPLAELGMPPEELERLRTALRQCSGLIVFAGSTWTGKNTTAYASLLEVGQQGGRSVASIEVAVRGRLPGVHQLEVREDIGFNEAAALRSVLRMDHDVIYMRELLDFETVQLCTSAVLKDSRLVLTTLHTLDAPGVVARLENMGLERWLIASTLRLVQAQRRPRRLCMHCRKAVPVEPSVFTSVGLPAGHPVPEVLYVPMGCEHCGMTGYSGRLLLCESMPCTPTLQGLIVQGASVEELRRAAVREGMRTLRVAGLERVREGVTSLEEVLLETPSDAG